MCLGSDSFVTPEEFGYSRKQSAQCSHSSRNISGCAVALNLLFLGKGRFQVWFLPLNVRQGQITWGSQVLRVCLSYPRPWGPRGHCWVLLGQCSPVTEQGTCMEQLLLLTCSGVLPPLRSQDAFFSCRC